MAKQAADNRTAELPGLPVPKRRGRPPSEAGPKSSAERQRDYRERKQAREAADRVQARSKVFNEKLAVKDFVVGALYRVKHAQACSAKSGLRNWSDEFVSNFLPDLRDRIEALAEVVGLDPARIAPCAGAPKSKRVKKDQDCEL